MKGVAALNLADFVKAKFGPDGFARLLAGLPPEQAQRLQAPIATEWFPLALHALTLQKMADLFWAGDATKAEAVGVDNLQKSVTGVYRVIVRMLDPEFLIRKSARLWTTFVDTGAMEVDRLADKRLRVRLEGIRSPHPAWCHSVGGSCVGALVACGARSPRCVHDECVFKGGARCAFVVTWS